MRSVGPKFEGLALRRLERQPIETDVDRDPIEPGGEARLPFEPLQALERADERILRQIGRVLVVADIAVTQLIHLAAVALDDDVEGLAVTVETELDERPVVGLGPRRIERHALDRRRQRVWSSQATQVPSRRGSAWVTRLNTRSTRDARTHLFRLDREGARRVKMADGIDFRFSFAYSARTMLPLTKRQREILDYLNDFIQQHGYAPSLEEIGRRFGLSSLATVHKHLTNLEEKGFIKRAWNRSRSVELVPTRLGSRALELPLLGYVAAGSPIEAVVGSETIAVPEDLVGKRDSYVLRVRGDSMIDEQIRDGDYVIVEDRRTADNGEMVIALLNGSDVTLKKLYREQGRIRLQPANAAMQPMVFAAEQVQVQGVVVGVMRRY